MVIIMNKKSVGAQFIAPTSHRTTNRLGAMNCAPTFPISLGIFTYLNIQPVYYGLLHEQQHEAINLVTGVPTRLNAALLSGEVDLSCVSGSAFAEHSSEFRLIPHLSISAPG